MIIYVITNEARYRTEFLGQVNPGDVISVGCYGEVDLSPYPNVKHVLITCDVSFEGVYPQVETFALSSYPVSKIHDVSKIKSCFPNAQQIEDTYHKRDNITVSLEPGSDGIEFYSFGSKFTEFVSNNEIHRIESKMTDPPLDALNQVKKCESMWFRSFTLDKPFNLTSPVKQVLFSNTTFTDIVPSIHSKTKIHDIYDCHVTENVLTWLEKVGVDEFWASNAVRVPNFGKRLERLTWTIPDGARIPSEIVSNHPKLRLLSFDNKGSFLPIVVPRKKERIICYHSSEHKHYLSDREVRDLFVGRRSLEATNELIRRRQHHDDTDEEDETPTYESEQTVHSAGIENDAMKVVDSLVEKANKEWTMAHITDFFKKHSFCETLLLEVVKSCLAHDKYFDAVNGFIHLVQEHEHLATILTRFKQEVEEGLGMCFIGKLVRIANALNGLVEGISICISENEDIGNIIVLMKRENSSKEEIVDALLERGHSREKVDEWTSSLE